jgi:hypothetical protein
VKKLEYHHVRFSPGFFAYISKKKFAVKMMAMLEEQAKAGWELRGCFHEGFEFHVHFIFVREIVQ